MSGFERSLRTIYGDDWSREVSRLDSLGASFAACFGREAQFFFRAPGRVEIGGNHTDHQQGIVLTSAVCLDMQAAVALREDKCIRMSSQGYGMWEVDLTDLKLRKEEEGTTQSLIRGMAVWFAEQGMVPEKGFDMLVTSRVPAGSGLSSSAALETLLGHTMNELLAGGSFSPVELALAGKFAENLYFGKPSGLLDQLASSVGGLVSVDFENPAAPKVVKLSRDLRDFPYVPVIVNCGAGHQNLTAEYAAIPGECKAVAAYFGKSVLRELPEEEFLASLPALRGEFGDRAVLRCMHVYRENERALEEAKALEEGRDEDFIALVRESGRSSAQFLQNVVPSGSVRNQEMMVTLAVCEKALKGRGAVRVHGGGFGGTVLAFVPREELPAFEKTVADILGEGLSLKLDLCPVGGTMIKEEEA